MLILVKFPSFYLNTALIDNYGSPIRMRVVKKRRFERSPQKKNTFIIYLRKGLTNFGSPRFNKNLGF